MEQLLESIGAGYFISYLYGKFIDKNHKNYQTRGTDMTKTIEKNKVHFYEMICLVCRKNEKMLNKNEIGLTGKEVLQMANELRILFDKNTAASLHICAGGELSLGDVGEVATIASDAILNYEREELGYRKSDVDTDFIPIVDIQNGSIIFTFLVNVVAEVGVKLIEFIADKVSKKYREKHKDDSCKKEIRIETDGTDITVIIFKIGR